MSALLRAAGYWLLALIIAGGYGIILMAFVQSSFRERQLEQLAGADQTTLVCGLAGITTILFTWKLIGIVSLSGLLQRILFSLATHLILFSALGGVFVIIFNILTKSDPIKTSWWQWLIHGFYWDSVNGFYAFAIFVIGELKLEIIGLFFIASVAIAILAPWKQNSSTNFGRI
ncbi:MAG: hypothetical protein ACR2OW_16495 [Methyloligellaceae bacterium]